MKRMELIRPMKDEMLAKLARLVRHNSRQGEALEGKPFGEGPAAALAEALEIGREMGFRTVNLDNYCGYIEIGAGSDIIGIAAHLDIVPAGEGWDTDPFTLTEKDGWVYGRGVSDDKGAVIATLYAMKLLRESGVKLDKRIRLILGCNEESGSLCMKHYNEVEEPLTSGFTPDGNFPGIYGEKGMCAMLLRCSSSKIVSIEGGFVSNAVCSRCVTKIQAGSIGQGKLKNALDKTPLTSYTLTEEDGLLVIDAVGTAAHASTPLLGVNAAAYTLSALKEAGFKDDFVDFYLDRIGLACDGAGLGLKISDKYGDLTLNNGIVSMKDGEITCTIDIRFPVTYTTDQIRDLATPYLTSDKGTVEIQRLSDPLFYPPDSPLVRALYNAYVEVTGDTSIKPQVIGGGTYAKSLHGIIAFGCEFPDADNHIHDANEKLDIEEFLAQTAIYTQAILNLLQN